MYMHCIVPNSNPGLILPRMACRGEGEREAILISGVNCKDTELSRHSQRQRCDVVLQTTIHFICVPPHSLETRHNYAETELSYNQLLRHLYVWSQITAVIRNRLCLSITSRSWISQLINYLRHLIVRRLDSRIADVLGAYVCSYTVPYVSREFCCVMLICPTETTEHLSQ